jgi:hypothetical protein
LGVVEGVPGVDDDGSGGFELVTDGEGVGVVGAVEAGAVPAATDPAEPAHPLSRASKATSIVADAVRA